LRTAALEVGRQSGATLFMTLLAAYAALLHRYTGETDLLIGTPIANRGRAEIAGLIGFFVNTLALRARLDGGPTFRELLGRVREETLWAYARPDLPFERLVEELAPERSLSRARCSRPCWSCRTPRWGPWSCPGWPWSRWSWRGGRPSST
jgi:non-ribosomal peptide synthetase component F